jgi:FixJ family two-component response regulator
MGSKVSQRGFAAEAPLRAKSGPPVRDIMLQVVRGRLNKQIAGDMGIAEATVKVHRSRAMRKMNVRSLPELGQMIDKFKLGPDEPQHF